MKFRNLSGSNISAGTAGFTVPPHSDFDASSIQFTSEMVRQVALAIESGYLVALDDEALRLVSDSASPWQNSWLNTWLNAASAGWEYKTFRPLTLTATANSLDMSTTPQPGVSALADGWRGITIGNPGAAGDYLEELQITVLNSTGHSQVLLQDTANPLAYDNAGTTAFGNQTTFSFGKTTSSLPAVANWLNSYLVGSFTIGTSGTAVLARKINNLTVGGPTSLTIDSLAVSDPAGNVINATAVGAGSYLFTIQDLITANPRGVTTPGALPAVKIQSKSKYGGWRIFTDCAVVVTAVGNFS
jgi:hypothetical protein